MSSNMDFDGIVLEHTEPILRSLGEGARGVSEAELLSRIDGAIRDFIVAIGGQLDQAVSVERRVVVRDPENPKASARIDRLFNTVVVEFEAPGALRETNEARPNRHAIKQVMEQVDALIAHEGWMEEKVSGVACDGKYFIFCRRNGSQWIVESPVAVDERSVARFLRLLASIRRPPMLPGVIAKRFGIEQEDVAVSTIREFFEALKGSHGRRSGVLLRQWQEFYADVAGLDVDKVSSDKDLTAFAQKITKKRTTTADELARVLFSTYT